MENNIKITFSSTELPYNCLHVCVCVSMCVHVCVCVCGCVSVCSKTHSTDTCT